MSECQRCSELRELVHTATNDGDANWFCDAWIAHRIEAHGEEVIR